jgi:hypothetical protein
LGYIGNTPADKFLTLAKQSFSTSATTSYTLDSAVSSTQDIALFINNVRQSPVDAYSVSGTALTLTSATAGTDEMYCVYLGKTVGTVSPASDSVTTAMLQANAVTGAKLNTDVISAQTALGATPADTDELLVSDAGVLKRVDYSHIKGGGKILQVEQVTEPGGSSQTINSSSTWVALTDMTDTITTSSGSSVLIILDTNVYVDNNIGYSIRITFNHSGISETDVYVDDATNTAVLHNGITRVNTNNTLIIKHSPSTTNEITYTAYARNSGESYFNNTRTSSLTLMEIGS